MVGLKEEGRERAVLEILVSRREFEGGVGLV